jgi:predicted amidohydrolase
MPNLVAVQAHISLEVYQSSDTFRRWVLEMTEEAVQGLGDAQGLGNTETLVAFPELIGFPLLLTLADKNTLHDKTMTQAVQRFITAKWLEVIRQAVQQRHFSISAALLPSALPAYLAYKNAFAEAAQTFKVTLIAGSSLLPHISEEASRNVHITNPKVYNTSFIFAPTGTLLGRSHKTYLTPGLESRLGLSRGRLGDLQVLRTPVGRVAVPICLDAFYTSVIDHVDGLGAEIVVMPSANPLPWAGRWAANPELTEGEAWLKYGLAQQIQNRLHIRYGVNPMLVGQVWDIAFEGCSSLVTNTLNANAQTIAQAKNATSQDYVRATVDALTSAR